MKTYPLNITPEIHGVPQYGVMAPGRAIKEFSGKWMVTVWNLRTHGFKTRREALAHGLDLWEKNFSKRSLESRYLRHTKGGHIVKFCHQVDDDIVAICDGFTTTWNLAGRCSTQDGSMEWDLVKRT